MTKKTQNKNALVIGGGAIGAAIRTALSQQDNMQQVHLISRHCGEGDFNHPIKDYDSMALQQSAHQLRDISFDLIIIATGTLQGEHYQPEKSLKAIQTDAMQQVYQINTIIPALIMQSFAPLLRRNSPTIMAALSARVGSIADNQMGGWYSYRASKAALNMIIKCTAIELRRKNPESIVIGLHPGTVDSPLSKPFQHGVPAEKLFTAAYSAQKLLQVINSCHPEQSGKCFAWDGKEIPF